MARILIIGGSLGGLFAANLLLRDGHDVTVFERAASSLEGRGAGIVTHPQLDAALARAGLTDLNELGVAVRGRVLLGADGSVRESLALPQVLTSWSRLYSLLKGVFPSARYQNDAVLMSHRQSVEGLSAEVKLNGVMRTYDADLLIACDGIRSAVREIYAPGKPPIYAGYVAWRGMCEETALSQFTLDSLFCFFGFGLAPGEQILGYPVVSTSTHKQRSYNVVWYRSAPDEPALRNLMSDADGVHYPHGISPAKVSYRHIAEMRRAAHAMLAPQFAEVMEKTAQPFLQPIYDFASDSMAFGRVALLGDAASVARPHVGMGVTKAAQDACELADCIRKYGATPESLQAYSAIRVPASCVVVERGRELGAGLARPSNSKANDESTATWTLSNTAIDPSTFTGMLGVPAGKNH